jgi:hypothetical protein
MEGTEAHDIQQVAANAVEGAFGVDGQSAMQQKSDKLGTTNHFAQTTEQCFFPLTKLK